MPVCNPSPTDCGKKYKLVSQMVYLFKSFPSICCNGKLTLLFRKYGHGCDFQFIWRVTNLVLMVTEIPFTWSHNKQNYNLKMVKFVHEIFYFLGDISCFSQSHNPLKFNGNGNGDKWKCSQQQARIRATSSTV